MPYLHKYIRYIVKNNKLSQPSQFVMYITLVITYTSYYGHWDTMIQWQFFFVSRMCILYCAMPLGCNKMICVAQPVFLFCSERKTPYIP